MSNAWAAAIHLLEDDQPVGPPHELTPEEIDRIDDPAAYIRQRFEDYYFQFGQKLAGKPKKKLDNHTYLLQHPNGNITVRYHNTDIITITPDNRMVVSTVGKGANKYLGAQTRGYYPHPWAHYGDQIAWHTISTLDRINRFLPGKWKLYGKKPKDEAHTDWKWFWHGGGDTVEFTDGDMILGNGELQAQAAHERPATHP
jgi:hypothetical protein